MAWEISYDMYACLEWKSGAYGNQHGEVKNNYEHNVVIMNLPLCPQTADDVNVSQVNELQISNIQKLATAYFLSSS